MDRKPVPGKECCKCSMARELGIEAMLIVVYIVVYRQSQSSEIYFLGSLMRIIRDLSHPKICLTSMEMAI
jgi:hypothetical protein